MILAGRRINDGMGIFVAQQTVQAMASAKIVTLGSIVTVLGLTYKENCPDLRNSRIPDIILELQRYGCEVQVHDPYCDVEKAQEEFGITICDDNHLVRSQALVVALAHKIYQNWPIEKWFSLLYPDGIVVDVQNIVPRDEIQKAGYMICKI